MVEEYPWVYSHLGNALREKGRLSEAATNFQKACRHRGWKQCVEKDYFFSVDIFSYRIDLWTQLLASLKEQPGKALEVGSYQGMSSCWLLDNILTHPQSSLTCIDRQFDAKFKENISKTGAESRVEFQAGKIHQQMENCTAASFDLVNLQDRCRLIDHSEQNARLAWKLVKSGGFVIFSYYGWRNPNNPEQNPKVGIDRFLTTVKDKWQPIHLSPPAFQLVVRKL